MFIHGREAGWCRVQALRLPFPLKRLIFQLPLYILYFRGLFNGRT